jgi:hypothetical protein
MVHLGQVGGALLRRDGAKTGVLHHPRQARGPQPGVVSYRLTDGYEVTDLAFLPDGDMLVLERWYRPWRGVGARLRRVPARSLMPGAVLEGKLLLDLDLAHEIDNMEGLAIHREAGRTIVTMISDDNYSSLQRTILLEFELVG